MALVLRFSTWPSCFSVWVFERSVLHAGDTREQLSSDATCGIVDALALLRSHHHCHQEDDGAVGVELGGDVPEVIRELVDELFLPLAELVFGQVGQGKREG